MPADPVTEMAADLCRRFPQETKTRLAEKLAEMSGGALTVEQARSRIRRQFGANGVRDREKAKEPVVPTPSEQITQRTEGDNLEARSVSRTIRTVEDLLRHIEADMTRYEIASSEATKWEVATADRATGQPIVTELYRVFVKLKPKPGPGVRECVEAMIAAAAGSIKAPKFAKPRIAKSGTFAVIAVADVHLGKYCWHDGTGHGSYDLDIAARRLYAATDSLLDSIARHKPERILIAYMGDLFHCDNPGLTTTSGTALAGSTDGRLPKMIEFGSDALLTVPTKAAEIAVVDTVLVDGNHDATLSWAFSKIMAERFRNDGRVNVSREFTSRQYVTYGKNLLGFTHGHKAKKKLPQLMAIERPDDWSRCPYREWHTGHLHHQAAEMVRPIETLDGVVVRTAPSLSTPDDYHATNGWVGQREAMEAFIYDAAGGLAAMHVAGPRVWES